MVGEKIFERRNNKQKIYWIAIYLNLIGKQIKIYNGEHFVAKT
jgi:ribosomal protein S19